MLIVLQALHLVPVQAHSGIKQHNRNPNPDDFSGQDLNACITEDFGDLHRRGVYRPPGHKIPRIVKKNEEARAHTFVGHGVEEAVNGNHNKEEREHPPTTVGKAGTGTQGIRR